ncbi:MAG: hypothetical protein ACM3NV_02345, partial [Syntrophothermus sp.]
LHARVRAALEQGEQTAFDVVREIVGPENLSGPTSAWVLQIVLSVLDHMALIGEAVAIDGSDPQRWALT